MFVRAAAGAVLILGASAPLSAAQVSSLDLERFDGRWFEVERSPNGIQKSCWRAQIDLTRRAMRLYDVLVTCTRSPGGPVEILRASARPTETSNARLRFTLRGLLSFGGLAGQTYWVLDRDPDYRWVILALPDRSDWWIWHRDGDILQSQRVQLLGRARGLGLDTRRTVRTPPAD